MGVDKGGKERGGNECRDEEGEVKVVEERGGRQEGEWKNRMR